MKQPDSSTFISDAERILCFLRNSGFSTHASDRTSTSLTAGVRFRGKNVAVSIGLDRRDECVDCYITRVINGKFVKNDVPYGYRGHLHAFLVKHRGYRGTFNEFRDLSSGNEWWVSELHIYARALKQLAPDIIEDSDGIFDSNSLASA